MGFLSNLGKIAYGAMQDHAEQVEEYMDRYQYYSDQQLFSGLRSGSWASKCACSKLLQERGYDKEDIAEKMQR